MKKKSEKEFEMISIRNSYFPADNEEQIREGVWNNMYSKLFY